MSKRLSLIGLAGLIGLIILLVAILGSPTSEDGISVVVPGSPTSQSSSDSGLPTGQAGLSTETFAMTYINSEFGFSFEKPEGYTVGVVPGEDGSQTILVQPSSGQGSTVNGQLSASAAGFQIYITPLDEPVELTPDFIQKDLPGTLVKNAQKIELGDPGSRTSILGSPTSEDGNPLVAPGIMFESNSENFGGKSFEIWFTAPAPSVIASDSAAIQSYLFQISSYAEFADQLKAIIGTWKFN